MIHERSVCFCNSNPAWGGGEKWHLGAALGLAKRGCQVFVMTGKDTPLFERVQQYPQLISCPVRFSNLSFLNPLLVNTCAAFFRKKCISRVVLGTPSDLKGAGLAARKARIPGIYYRRGLAVPVKDNFLNRLVYGNFLTGLIVNSQETARLAFVNNSTLMDRNKVHIMPNGIDLVSFDTELAAAFPSFRHEEDVFVIGSAGRLTDQKGQHFLLHMSRNLLDAGVHHRLLLAGEGERRKELEELAHTLDLRDTILFAGFLADMSPFWQSIDTFVLPSLWEGFGYVLAEAQLAEKPVLAFDVNSMPEVVCSGETGLLLPPPSKNETDASVGARLAAAVRSLLDDPALAARLAANGRERCRKTYDQERLMDQLHALLWPEDAHVA